MRLILLNVFRMTPGVADLSTQGHSGACTPCASRNAAERNPWTNLHEDLGYGADISSVTVYAGSGFCNVENHGGNTPPIHSRLHCREHGQTLVASRSVSPVVVLSPEHATIVASTGWSKTDVQTYLFEQAKQSVNAMKRVMKFVPREYELQGRQDMHRGLSADDILIVVAGGDAGGHSRVHPFVESRSRLDLSESTYRRVHRLLITSFPTTKESGSIESFSPPALEIPCEGLSRYNEKRVNIWSDW